MTTTFEFGGYDLSFEVDAFGAGEELSILSDNHISAELNTLVVVLSATDIQTRMNDGSTLETATYYVADSNELSYRNIGSAVNRKFRLILHGQYLTIYINDKWFHTYSFSYARYPEEITVKLKANAGSSFTLANLVKREIPDWKEAIYVDIESVSGSAISSIIGQRPIDIYPMSDGSLAFEYSSVRPHISLAHIRSYAIHENYNPTACSDAIVYYTDVTVINRTDFARSDGFVSRVIRIPDLDYGAIKAARIQVQRAYQRQRMHECQCRFDPRVEPGDIVEISVVLTGTETTLVGAFVVETIQLGMADGENSMTLMGRDA